MTRYIAFFLSIFVFANLLSCTSNVDFDQVDNVGLNQNFTTAFLYIQANHLQFLNANASAENPDLTDISVIDIFDSSYVQDYLIKANFNFELENTFNRDFELEFSFLNANNNITKSFTINVPKNSNVNHLETFDGSDLSSLKLSKKVKMTLHLQPSSDSSMLDKDREMKFILKSFVNFKFKIN